MPTRDTTIKGGTVSIIFPKKERKQSETDKKRLSRFARKLREGRIGRFISWFEHIESKKELTESDFAEYKSQHGRLSNKVYKKNLNGNFYLYKKFKNATKAKKFMERLSG